MFGDLKVLVVVHVFTEGPHNTLEQFFTEQQVERLIMIEHPFYLSPKNRSLVKIYSRGYLSAQRCLFTVRRVKLTNETLFKAETLNYLLNFIATIFIILRMKERFHLYIGFDVLNALIGLLLKKLKIISKVVFYTIDYVPARFTNIFLNKLYWCLDKYCVNNCDATWNLSSIMGKLRTLRGVEGKQIVVPITTKLRNYNYNKNSRHRISQRTFCYVGTLRKGQGLDLIIEAVNILKRSNIDVNVLIIGIGPLKSLIQNRINDLGLQNNIRLLGYVSDKDLSEILLSCCAGLAPYEPYSIAIATDPAKIKLYLSYGLPIIMTDVATIAEEVSKHGAGIIIEYEAKMLAESMKKLINAASYDYEKMRDAATKLSKRFEYRKVFTQALLEVIRT